MCPSPSETRDTTLWQALRRRDAGAIEVLEERIGRVCRGVVRRWGASAEEVEVVLQDVLVSVWTFSGERTEEPRSLDQFLYWRARGALRTLRRRFPARADEAVLADSVVSCESDGPFGALYVEELSEALAECRAALDPKYRNVWEARYEQGMGTSESARHLGLDRSRIAVLLHRARRLLEACLEKKGLL